MVAASGYESASQLIGPAGGSWTWTTSGPNERSSRRRLIRFSGKIPMFETDEFVDGGFDRPLSVCCKERLYHVPEIFRHVFVVTDKPHEIGHVPVQEEPR